MFTSILPKYTGESRFCRVTNHPGFAFLVNLWIFSSFFSEGKHSRIALSHRLRGGRGKGRLNLKIVGKGREWARGSNSKLKGSDFSKKNLTPSYINATLSREMPFEKESKVLLGEQIYMRYIFIAKTVKLAMEKKTSIPEFSKTLQVELHWTTKEILYPFIS